MRYTESQRAQATRAQATTAIVPGPEGDDAWEWAEDPGDLREICGMMLPARVAAHFEDRWA